jgi:signal transduction histidine kinase
LNAYQALAGRGKLTLDTQRERHRERDQAREGILITLQDNGPGIPLETLPHIFEPFFTTKAEGQGSGLGLSICKLIVEDMGGRLAVDSRPGGPNQLPTRGPGGAAGRRGRKLIQGTLLWIHQKFANENADT